MNFTNAFAELNKLYESVEIENLKDSESNVTLDSKESVDEEVVEEGLLDAVKGAASGFVSGLKEDTDEDVEIEVEDDEAVAKQVVYECNNCGALVIKDEGEEVDSEEECTYCGEAKGFDAIGTFEAYAEDDTDSTENAEDDTDDTKEVAPEEPAEAEIIEVEDNETLE